MTLVAARFDGFAPAPTYRGHAAPGMTLAEIVAHVPDLPDWFWSEGEVRVDGEIIYRQFWLRYRPFEARRGRPGPMLVELYPSAPQGSRGKQALGLLASILLAVGTAGIGSGVLLGNVSAGLGSALGISAQAGASLLAAGVGIVGKMAIAALVPPPIAPNLAPSAENKPQAGVSANTIAPLRAFPEIVGALDYSPPHLIKPYSTIHGEDGDLRVHGIVGLTGRYLIENVRINDIAIADMPGVQVQTREGAPTDAALSLNATTAVEDAQPIQLSRMKLKRADDREVEDQSTPANSEPKWHVVQTRGSWKRFTIRLLYRAGLSCQHPENGPEKAGLATRIGFRKKGDSTWIAGPELHFTRGKLVNGVYRREISFELTDSPSGLTALTPDADSNQPHAFWRAAQGQAFQYAANSYFNPGSGNYPRYVTRYTEGYRIYLQTSSFDAGAYEFRVMRGSAYRSEDFVPSTYVYDGSAGRAHFFNAVDHGGVYESAQTSETLVDECEIESVTTETDDYPFGFTGHVAQIAFQADAVQVQSITAKFTRYAPIYSGGNWATVQPTTNPAALYRLKLLEADASDPEDEELIEPGNFEAWYEHCVAKGYACNAVLDNLMADRSLQLIAAAGWAVPRNNGMRGVIIEHDRSAEEIEQKFTPVNSANLVITRAYEELPHAFRVEFNDEEDGYKLRDTYVYADGYDSTTATRIEAITDQGSTNRILVRDKYLLMMRQVWLRRRLYSLDVFREVLRSQRGALTGITSDVLASHHGFGMVKTVLMSGDDVAGVRLKVPVDMSFSAEATPGCAITLAAGQQLFKRLQEAAGKTDVLMFHTPIAYTADLVPDRPVSIGMIGQEYRRVLIHSIRPQKDLSHKLTFLDAADAIHADGCVAPAEEEAPGVVVSSAWAHVANGALTTAANGNLSLTEPSGAAEGDLLVAIIAYRNTAIFTAPEGWTIAQQEANPLTSGSSPRSSLVVAWRLRGSSAPSYAFTRSGGGVAQGGVIAFRGAAGSPADVSAKATIGMAGGGGFTWEQMSELVTTSGDELLVLAGAQAPDAGFGFPAAWSVTSNDPGPDEWTDRLAGNTSTGDKVGIRVATAIKKRNGGTGGLSLNFFSAEAKHAHIAVSFKSVNS
jgi:hypothetical protein